MGADTVISGVVRAVLPYAALAGVGFVGYTWLNKKGYLKGIKDGISGTVETISQVPTQIVDTIKDRTGADNFANDDWVGGTQQILRNIPIIYLGEKGFNAAKDGIEKILPDNPIPEIGSGGPVTQAVPESTWTDTPLKYVPGVAIRNGLVNLFGR